MAWNHDGTRLAGTANFGEAMIWDARSGDLTLSIKYSPANFTSPVNIDWTPDDTHLAIGGPDSVVRVWDAQGQSLWQAPRDGARITAVRFHPNGSQLATAESGAIVLWDVATGKNVAILNALQEEFRSLDWSPNAKRLISGSSNSVSVWDLATGHVAIKLANGEANCVRWSHDSKRVAAGSWGDGIHVWDASRGYERAGL